MSEFDPRIYEFNEFTNRRVGESYNSTIREIRKIRKFVDQKQTPIRATKLEQAFFSILY